MVVEFQRWYRGQAGAFLSEPMNLPPPDLGPLTTLGMLGLGGLHVAERVNGAA
jgi:hypothetical protein